MKRELLFKSLHPPRQKVDGSFPHFDRADDKRFSKRDSLVAQGQCDRELSPGPVPHVSASYVRMRMERDIISHPTAISLGPPFS